MSPVEHLTITAGEQTKDIGLLRAELSRRKSLEVANQKVIDGLTYAVRQKAQLIADLEDRIARLRRGEGDF